ncbi:Smr protein/MutS2 [Psychromonas sp. CNPT3]|uniref:endonuclease SmrB n=1 Tax=Psychromonas sp. CNPT3 TaxID=314282 RepID=UPI00006E615D|nr:endonuclease SmrB [Psychromonas sp. CNPT3]AGH81736.1 Smr protein/MutS2 [Psychromonas sp. CNPT3]
MSKHKDDDDDFSLFSAEFSGIKKLTQDSILLSTKNTKKKQFNQVAIVADLETEHFSDGFEPLLAEQGPVRYCRDDAGKYLLKQLRRGDFSPEIILDLHGLTQLEAKRELGALIACCKKEGLYCCSVLHGIGTYVLKKQVPLWLAQHPNILAFHQAPLEFGGRGALLVLIELEDWQIKREFEK